MMRVLVTGANGFVGRALVKRLAEEGDDVLAVTRPGQRAALAATGARVLEQDMLAWSGPARMRLDAVVHLAQSRRYREFPQAAAQVSGVIAQGAVLAADLACRSGATQLLYASTGSLYAPGFAPVTEATPVTPRDFYARTKHCGEQLIEDFRKHFDLKIVRPFFIYGPGQRLPMIFPRLLESVRNGAAITLDAAPGEDATATGGLRFSPHYVDDHVECLVRLLRRPGHALLNLAGRQQTDIREVATVLGRLLGRTPELRSGANARPGDFVVDTTCLTRTLGEVPSTTLEQGLSRVVAEARKAQS